MKTIYGVFTQYEPTYKYEEALQSLWETKELAEEAAAKETGYDYVSVREVYINTNCLWVQE